MIGDPWMLAYVKIMIGIHAQVLFEVTFGIDNGTLNGLQVIIKLLTKMQRKIDEVANSITLQRVGMGGCTGQ